MKRSDISSRWRAPTLAILLVAASGLPTTARPASTGWAAPDAPMLCTPGQPNCCGPRGVLEVPRIAPGQTATQFRQRLLDMGFETVKLLPRPAPDGIASGQVLASNPRARTSVCGTREIWLYVAAIPPKPESCEACKPPPTASEPMIGLVGRRVVEARELLGEVRWHRADVLLCGRTVSRVGLDGLRELIVADQWPPRGTDLANPAHRIQLRVAPKAPSLIGMTLEAAQASLATPNEPSLWSLRPVNTGIDAAAAASAGSTREPRRILAASLDPGSCRIEALLGTAPETRVETKTLTETKPGASTSMLSSALLPMGSGALGGALLARLLTQSGGGDAPSPVPGDGGASMARRPLRVRRDVAGD